jgi:glycosyltransferase
MVSIITVAYNDKQHIQMVMDSILSQTYDDYESIVIDGGSTDGTVDVIKEYEIKMNGKMRWISECDNGIYDAINKGIKMAQGDIIGLLYDRYANENVLKKIAETFQNTGCDVVHGDLEYRDENNKVIRHWHMGEGRIQDGWMAGHPTLYVKAEVYNQYGLYDLRYKGGADYDFEVRIFKDGKLKIEYIPEVLIYMFYGGTSTNSIHGYWRSFKEGVLSLKRCGVSHPILINIKRVIIVLKQFKS